MGNFALVIELDRHIEILLLDNDCVIVPGLGGFVTHHVEARYDEEGGTFLPPLRTLGFNPQLKLNDSLLAQSYVEAYDISYPEAMRRIEAEVAELRAQLADEGSYELNDIGVLSLNEDGNCLFEPCEAGILTPDLYGLGTVSIAPFEEKKEAAPAPAHPALTEAKVNGVLQQPSEAVARETEEEERTIRIKVSWLRNAVAVAAAVIAFFLITPPVQNAHAPMGDEAAQQSAMFAQLLPQAQPEASVKEETAPAMKEEAAPAVHADVPKAEAKTEPEAASPAKASQEAQASAPAKAQGAYCIVMASHVAKTNAEAYVKQLKAEGYEQAEVYIYNKVVRVVYGHYKSEAEAYNELRTVRGNRHFEQSWVYKKQ